MLKSTFAAAMKRYGFVKKSDGWYHQTPEVILVANLQKSNSGEQYFVNFGIWLKALGEVLFPKEYQCHIRIRPAMLELNEQTFWEDEIFNLESIEIDDVRRFELIGSFLESKSIPFLLECGSLESVRRLYREGRFKHGAVMQVARRMLES